MKKPILVEMFSDNGRHSHWRLVNEHGEELCSEEDKDKIEDLTILLDACRNAAKSKLDLSELQKRFDELLLKMTDDELKEWIIKIPSNT